MRALSATAVHDRPTTARAASSNVPVVSRPRQLLVTVGRWLTGVIVALRAGWGVMGAIAALRGFMERAKRIEAAGIRPAPRFVTFGGRYYRSLYAPGWPSRAFNEMVAWQLEQRAGPQTAVLAITSRCHLRCRHCFEWTRLSRNEPLSLKQLQLIIERLQELGVSQIQLSGGEPLCRYDDLLTLINGASCSIDFWLLTSGVGLTAARAQELSAAGLTGVVVSLDHHQRAMHDAFRGRPGTFDRAVAAVAHARAANLGVGLSLCATREIVNLYDLRKYAGFANELGVAFIQLLEPRAVGRYAGSDDDVTLQAEQRLLLEAFYKHQNFNAPHDTPIVEYPALLCRRLGCQGGGHRTIYIDSRGDIHRCPFSASVLGNALQQGDLAPRQLQRIRAAANGCPFARTSTTERSETPTWPPPSRARTRIH